MCIIAVAYKMHEDHTFIVAANRDEFYKRETAPLSIWEEAPHIYAGRDIEKGGTWLAVSKEGRFAAVTNYRDPSLPLVGERSRGSVPVDFLNSEMDASTFAKQLQQQRRLYGAFNVLLFDGDVLVHYNTITNKIEKLPQGIHCVSNATINTEWPKVKKLKENFTTALQQKVDDEQLFHILHDEEKAPDELLPSTGVPFTMEQQLSSIFIHFEGYGTRASTVVKSMEDGWAITERTFVDGEETQNIHFHIATTIDNKA